jgi:hypothetical protein
MSSVRPRTKQNTPYSGTYHFQFLRRSKTKREKEDSVYGTFLGVGAGMRLDGLAKTTATYL